MDETARINSHFIDHERLDRLHDGSRSQIISVLHLFLDEVMPDFGPLDEAVRQHQWPEAADMAHKIVPWVGMVGLTTLETELRNLEIRAKTTPDADGVTDQWLRFKTGLNQAVPLLRQELARLS